MGLAKEGSKYLAEARETGKEEGRDAKHRAQKLKRLMSSYRRQ